MRCTGVIQERCRTMEPWFKIQSQYLSGLTTKKLREDCQTMNRI